MKRWLSCSLNHYFSWTLSESSFVGNQELIPEEILTFLFLSWTASSSFFCLVICLHFIYSFLISRCREQVHWVKRNDKWKCFHILFLLVILNLHIFIIHFCWTERSRFVGFEYFFQRLFFEPKRVNPSWLKRDLTLSFFLHYMSYQNALPNSLISYSVSISTASTYSCFGNTITTTTGGFGVDRVHDEEQYLVLWKRAIYISLLSFVTAMMLCIAGFVLSSLRSSASTAAFAVSVIDYKLFLLLECICSCCFGWLRCTWSVMQCCCERSKGLEIVWTCQSLKWRWRRWWMQWFLGSLSIDRVVCSCKLTPSHFSLKGWLFPGCLDFHYNFLAVLASSSRQGIQRTLGMHLPGYSLGCLCRSHYW